MIPNYVVIPFRGKLDMTSDIVHELALQGECEEIFAFNNGPHEDLDWPCTVIDAEDMNLHAMYNLGIWRAIHSTPEMKVNVGIFNNDIEVGRRFISRLDFGLRSHKNYAAVCGSGDWSDENYQIRRVRSGGGFEGPTMFIKGELDIWFDESYEWWCGDTDWAAQAESAGLWLGQVPNAHFTHLDGGSVSVKEYAGQIDYWAGCHRDVGRFHEKWPMIPEGQHCIPQEWLDNHPAA